MEILNKYKHEIPEDAVCIMRGHPLGNLFVIGEHGDRPEVIAMYKQWLRDKILDKDPEVLAALKALTSDSKLFCCCAPADCHGNVVKEYWEEITAFNGNFDDGVEEFCKRHKQVPVYSPFADGVDHINIYSKARTKLGYALSNFARTSFDHPEFGHFESMEGFWYWLSTGGKKDIFRTLVGYQAKKEGLKHKVKDRKDFDDQIKLALRMKVQQNPAIKAMLKTSSLPFTHYYWYGTPENAKVITSDGGDWFASVYEEIRREVKTEPFKLIIAGSRSITDYEVVKKAYLESGLTATEIVVGKARGVDTLAEQLAAEMNIPIKEFPADWDDLGKRAGIIRNCQMGDYADGVLAIWDGQSPGTQHMIAYMLKQNKVAKVRKIAF